MANVGIVTTLEYGKYPEFVTFGDSIPPSDTARRKASCESSYYSVLIRYTPVAARIPQLFIIEIQLAVQF